MRFEHPWILLFIPLIVSGIWWLYRHGQQLSRQKLALFGPPHRLPNVLRAVNPAARRRKAILFGIAAALLVTAAARPMWGPRKNSTPQQGAEFFFVLDVSKSMLVRDVKPNRLEAVKASLAEWLKTRHGDRIGLIVMAGDAFVQAPLTNDYVALREVLKEASPYTVSKGGTNIPFAVQTAVKSLEIADVKHKAVVFISDGENLEGDVLKEISETRLRDRITFLTVGVGTLEGGSVPDRELKPDFTKPPKMYVKDEYGVIARSRLDERSLRQIATAGGGRYLPFLPDTDVWETLYTQGIAPLAARTDTFSPEDFEDLFQIPLGLALLLLAYELSIRTRRKNPEPARSIVSLPKPAKAPPAASMPSPPPAVTVSKSVKPVARPKVVAK